MAPLPPNNTGRLFLDYTTGVHEHTLSVRFDSATTLAPAANFLSIFLNDIELLLPASWQVTGARYQMPLTDLTLPYSDPTLTSFAGGGGGTLQAYEEPREWVYVGRSSVTGRRWELSIYGLLLATPGDYRLGTGSLPPAIGASLDTIASATSTGAWVAIDGNEFVVYPYVNCNFNSYWEARQR